MKIELPAYSAAIINRLEAAGYEAYVVGGCVRDAVLGRTPKDWDVCTSALPEQVIACFADERVVPTGAAHGTVTVLLDKQPVEVTTYRVDGSYSDSRHPDSVQFTPRIQEDLARRDFTVNAMAYHPRRGLVDPFGGRQDLKECRIRCVGEPTKRFEEDALRILRGARFASVLDFAIDPPTLQAMNGLAGRLCHVSTERIWTEWNQLVCGKRAGGVLSALEPVCAAALPGWPLPAVPQAFAALDRLPPLPGVRLAALYAGFAGAEQAMRDLRAPKKIIAQVALLAAEAAMPVPDNMPDVRKLVFRCGRENAEQVLAIMTAFEQNTQRARQLFDECQEKHLCCDLANLAVSGRHVARLVQDPQQTGALLERLLVAVMEEQVPNEKGPLIALAKQWTA